MDSNNEFKETYFKKQTWNQTCSYFDDVFKIEDIDLDNISMHEKSYENILVYNTSYKVLVDSKPLGIRSDKINRFIRNYNGSRYLILFLS